MVSGETATVRISALSDTSSDAVSRRTRRDATAKVTASAHHLDGTGVTIRELLTRAGVPEGEALRGRALSSAVVVTGADGYRVVFGIAEFDPAFTDRVAILADRKDDAPLPANAAPFQLVITGEKRPARWVRQVVSIEVTSIGQP
jgi:hypothetical protein